MRVRESAWGRLCGAGPEAPLALQKRVVPPRPLEAEEESESERVRVRVRELDVKQDLQHQLTVHLRGADAVLHRELERERERVCVCVCVSECERERPGGGRGGGLGSHPPSSRRSPTLNTPAPAVATSVPIDSQILMVNAIPKMV